MRLLALTFILFLLLPTNTNATVSSFSHPDDQYEVSRSPSFIDKNKDLSWSISFSDHGMAIFNFAIIPKSLDCGSNIINTPEGEFITNDYHLILYSVSGKITHSISIIDAFTELGAFDGSAQVWDNPHEGTLGDYVCGAAAAEAISSDQFEKTHTATIKIYANLIDKGVEAVVDQVTDPFSSGNLYWTLGIILVIIGIIVFIKYKRKK